MKQLLIHIGYPKTATTTLQNHLFTVLDGEKKLNYLGRSNKICKRFQYGEEFVSKLVFDNKGANIDSQYFSEDLLNVISNEDIVLSFKNISQNKVLNDSDPTKVPEKLYSIFHSLDYTVKILVTIRAQVDMIHSFYVEGFKWHFRHEKSLDTFEKYLLEGVGKKENGIFLMFYYYNVIKSYVDVFGLDNVKILLYEDMVYDKENYIKEVSEFLSIDSDTVGEVIFNKKDNVKLKNNEGSYTNHLTFDQIVIDMFRRLLPRYCFVKLKENKGLRYFVINMTKFLRIFKFGSVKFIPKLDENQKVTIYDEFCHSNYKLATEFGVDINKLKRYGYVK